MSKKSTVKKVKTSKGEALIVDKDISTLKVTELRALCKSEKIDCPSKAIKAELVKLISEHRKESTGYEKMKVDELKELCKAKDIECKGLKKSDMIALLKEEDTEASKKAAPKAKKSKKSSPKSKAKKAAPKAKKAAKKTTSEEDDLSAMKVVQLKKICKQLGIEKCDSKLKAQLVEEIKKKRRESEAPSEEEEPSESEAPSESEKEDDLESMTLLELKKLCKERGLASNCSSFNKADVLSLLRGEKVESAKPKKTASKKKAPKKEAPKKKSEKEKEKEKEAAKKQKEKEKKQKEKEKEKEKKKKEAEKKKKSEEKKKKAAPKAKKTPEKKREQSEDEYLCIDEEGENICPEDEICYTKTGKCQKMTKKERKPIREGPLRKTLGDDYSYEASYRLVGGKSSVAAHLEKIRKLRGGRTPEEKSEEPESEESEESESEESEESEEEEIKKDCRAKKKDPAYIECDENTFCHASTGECTNILSKKERESYYLLTTTGERKIVGDKQMLKMLNSILDNNKGEIILLSDVIEKEIKRIEAEKAEEETEEYETSEEEETEEYISPPKKPSPKKLPTPPPRKPSSTLKKDLPPVPKKKVTIVEPEESETSSEETEDITEQYEKTMGDIFEPEEEKDIKGKSKELRDIIRKQQEADEEDKKLQKQLQDLISTEKKATIKTPESLKKTERPALVELERQKIAEKFAKCLATLEV